MTLATRLPLLTARTPRALFLDRVRGIVGPNTVRLLWTPDGDDGLVCVDDSPYRHVLTHSHTPQGRLTRQGHGWLLASTTAGAQFISVGDSDVLSFGDGATDRAFSGFVIGNSTNTAAARRYVTKYNLAGTTREWLFGLSAGDLLALSLADEDANVLASRLSDAAITMGSLTAWGFSYDGSGGATAANGVTFYQAGVLLASTAFNDASYVSMVNTSVAAEIGANSADSQYNDGTLGLILVCAGALTANQQLALVKQAANPYFGTAL